MRTWLFLEKMRIIIIIMIDIIIIIIIIIIIVVVVVIIIIIIIIIIIKINRSPKKVLEICFWKRVRTAPVKTFSSSRQRSWSKREQIPYGGIKRFLKGPMDRRHELVWKPSCL